MTDRPPLTATFFQGDNYATKAISPAWATWFNKISSNISAGSVTGVENVGDGQGVFKQRTLATLEFYSLISANAILGISLSVDDVLLTIDETAINHDNLTNYNANQHIDWTNTTSNFLTTGTVTGSNVPTGAATQANMEAASSTTLFVSPGRAQYHPGVAKAWVKFASSSTIQASYNVSSITDNGVGDFTINFTTAFSSANYSISAMSGTNTTGGQNSRTFTTGAAPSTTAARIIFGYVDSSGVLTVNDENYNSIVFFGDQ